MFPNCLHVCVCVWRHVCMSVLSLIDLVLLTHTHTHCAPSHTHLTIQRSLTQPLSHTIDSLSFVPAKENNSV